MPGLPGTGFRQLLDAVPDAVLVVDHRGSIVALNSPAERLFGGTEAELVGEPLTRLIPARFQTLTEPQGAHVSLLAQRHDGSEFPAELHRNVLGAGSDALAIVTVRDLTKWRRAQEILFREKEQASVTLASIADGVITTDVAGTITYLNPTAERLTGWRMTEALGQPLATVVALISDATRQPIEDIAARCLREGRAVDLADGVVLVRRDGTEVPIGDSAAPLRDHNGTMIGVVMVFHDVTERRRATRALSHDATHDALTGLVSRQEFERRLARVLADRTEMSEHALCYLNLDRFKLVNDSGGREAGDDVLRAVARLLRSRLRSRDTAARLDGDEFAILLENCSPREAEEIAGNMRQAIDDLRYVWGEHGERTYTLGVSIGVLPISTTSGSTADVIRAADDACYVAKDAGGNCVHLAHAGTATGARQLADGRRLARLTRAVNEGHFQLYTQAIVPLAPVHAVHAVRHRCEILLRLPDEQGGLETAASFLPHAERYRLTPAIDRWVVRQTVGLVGRWHREHPECELPLCSINLSVSSLEDPDLIPALREYLAQHRLPPEAISFEIDEAAALGKFTELVRLIAEIRAVGCGVGLDDFGQGLSSFAHLKALSLDFVKIGGHYVRGVEDPVYGTLVSTVNQIGRIMGITTIAGEVENDTILEKMRELGMGYAQGQAVAPPQPLADADGEVSLPLIQRLAVQLAVQPRVTEIDRSL